MRALIDDPESGEPPSWRRSFIDRLGAADCIPFTTPRQPKTKWDLEYEELMEAQRQRVNSVA